MAEKLSIEIALEGGKEIERQLEGIGKTGEKAFDAIAKSAEQVGGFKNLDPEFVTEKLREMGVTGKDAVDKIQAAVKEAAKLETFAAGVQTLEKAFGKLGLNAEETKQALLRLREAGKLESVVAFVQKLQDAFSAIGRVAGPAIAAITAALGSVVISTFKFADAIGKVSAEAMKLELTIEQFDRLRLGLEKAGISANAIADGIKHLKGELDKLDLDTVSTAFRELEAAAKRGFGAQGTAQLKLLEEAAKGTGAAAKQAREALQKLGLPIPKEAQTALERLGIAGGKVDEILPQVVEKLRQMPDSAQRTATAIAVLGDKLGIELIGALRTGGVAIDQFLGKTNTLTQEQAITAAQVQQAWNRLMATWERFSSLTLAPAMIASLDLATAAIEKLASVIAAVGPIFSATWNVIASVATPVLQTISQAWQGFVMAFTAGLAIIQSAWTPVLQTISQAWQGFVMAFTAGLAIIQSAWNAMWQGLQGAATSVIDAVTGAWNGLASAGTAAMAAIQGAIDGVIGTISSLIDAIGNAISALANLLGMGGGVGAPGGGGGGGGGGNAAGGLIGGRGTGTSDSNLAWVSRGEHIMPARAVRQPGVLAFLEALRRSGGNLSRVLDGMGRFALGGPVGVPSFAGGGLNGMSNVTIQFPGLPAIGGLRATSGVVDELRKAAALAQVRSGGRKPSRYS
jgi:hypothetical protein